MTASTSGEVLARRAAEMRTLTALLLFFCVLTFASAADAQLANNCLRPLAIPDKWIENQTPPWDGTDTFNPSGTTPDVYSTAVGYDPAVDDGRALVLHAGAPGSPLNAGNFIPVDLPRDPPIADAGGYNYRENIYFCAGTPLSIGASLALEIGNMIGPTAQGIATLIAQDPNAYWDAVTRSVRGSAFAQSPRVIALPVFDTGAFEEGRLQGQVVIRIVKFVGYFVASMVGNDIEGYLTARGTLTALPSHAFLGDATTTLSARVDAPGGGMSGVPVDFTFDGAFAGSATTGSNQFAALPNVPIGTSELGTRPGIIGASLGTGGGFLLADSSTADLSVDLATPTLVLWASNVHVGDAVGKWQRLTDSTAAGGSALQNPNAGKSKIVPALVAPANYFETTFFAAAGIPYHVWVRMRAQNNSLSNDSIHLQFSDSARPDGYPTLRIGTTSSAEFVLQDGPSDAGDHGWGWADNGWGGPGLNVYFATSGRHTLRIQQREDGAIVDQIVISAGPYLTSPPGARDNDATILPFDDGSRPPPSVPPTAQTAVLWASDTHVGDVVGSWQRLADTTAAGTSALWNPNAGKSKIAPALASPGNYFETTFTAVAGTPYHVWIRLRAQGNSLSNDSVHAQFSDSVTSTGTATMRIGTTSSAEFVLQDGSSDPSDQNWGWADNGWGMPGKDIYFATTGSHTIRVQQREDGAIVDQIVISPDTYLTSPPGPRNNDTTVLGSQN